MRGARPQGGRAPASPVPGTVIRAPPPRPRSALCLGGWGLLCSLARQRDKPICQWEGGFWKLLLVSTAPRPLMGTSWASPCTLRHGGLQRASVPTRAHTSVAVPQATMSHSQLALPSSPSRRTPARSRHGGLGPRLSASSDGGAVQLNFKVKHEGMNQMTV